MKLTLAFWCLLVFNSIGQNSKISDFPMSESSLLWEISRADLNEPSYLFGTIHLISEENYFLPDTLVHLLEGSDILMMEIDLNFDQANIADLLILTEDRFSDYFTKEQMDTVLTWVEQYLGATPEEFETSMGRLKPFVFSFIAANIDALLGEQGDSISGMESYEVNLDAIADTAGIQIAGLETVEEQISFFDNLSKEQQAEFVMASLRENETGINTELENYYLSQNVDSIYILIDSLGGVLSTEQSVFLNKRNINWVPKIMEIIVDRKAFIAVGAGHLGGPSGLIRLLQREGYTLKPVEL